MAASSLLVGLVTAVPRMPPCADLPHHELILGALRGLGDPQRFPSPPYE